MVVIAALASACAGESLPTDSADDGAESTTSTVPAVDPDRGVRRHDPCRATAEAYVAGYPLVVTTRTLQRLGGLLGVNQLFWQPALSARPAA